MNLRNRLPFYISLIQQGLEWFGYPLICTKAKAKPLKNYKVYGNTEQGGIPESYTRLEYIEGDGNPYIVTDFFFDDVATDTITCDFMRTNTGAGTILYGFRDAYKVNGYGFQFNDTGRTYRQYGDSDTGLGSTYVFNLNTRYTATQTGYTYVIGGRTSAVVVETAPIQNYPLTVFATRNANQPTTAITPMRLYNLNVVNASGVMILNLVPVRRKDGVLGLYDTIKGGFYTNSGTGTFVAGQEVGATPTQPLMIESVGEKTKNIFDVNNALLGYGIGTTGIIAPTTSYNCSNYIEVEPNTTYIRLNNETPLGNFYHLYDKDKNWIERRSATSTGLMTTSADTKYIAVAIDIAVSLDTYQIVEGSTATAYEPYGYKIPVNVANKNIFDYEDFFANYQTYSTSAVGRFPIKLKPNTKYTVSTNTSRESAAASCVFVVSGNAINWSPSSVDNGVLPTASRTVTTDSEGWLCIGMHYNRPEYKCSIEFFRDGTSWVQIEEGNAATVYEPHFNETTNIYLSEPLRKLGDYADYIDYANQKVVRKVGEIAFNGNESWTYYNISGVGKLFRTVVNTKFASGTKYDLGIICDKYTTVEQSARTNNTMTGIDRNVDLVNNNFSDVTSWKAELASSNITVVYPLATPTEESITLPQITLPGEVTITTETTVKPSDMYGKQ